MSTKANPTVIGSFVVGAAVLAVAGLAFFGGGEFFAEKQTYVAYFDGSLKGLDIGSPVTFRGIKIGAVSNILVRYDSADHSVRIPVYFELEQGRVSLVRKRVADQVQSITTLMEAGLRAQLSTQSFVTGQIAIEIDFHTDAPIVLVGAEPDVPEFPTLPTTLARMGKALEDFDLEGLLDDIRGAVKGIDELAQSSDLRDAIAALDETIKHFGELAQNINAKVDPIARDIDETAAAARQAMEKISGSVVSVKDTLNPAIGDARELLQNVDAKVNPVVAQFVKTTERAQQALDEVRHFLVVARNDIAEDSELYRSAVDALNEAEAAARSFRNLSDLLEQHPEALLQGKGTSGAK